MTHNQKTGTPEIPPTALVEVPAVFRVGIGGFWGPSYEVEWLDAELHYRWEREGRHGQEVIIPSVEHWRQLKGALDRIKVWKWAHHYEQPVLDGTGWSLQVEWGQQTLETSGSNAYPTRTGAQSAGFDPTPPFKEFLAAISRLVGGRTFK